MLKDFIDQASWKPITSSCRPSSVCSPPPSRPPPGGRLIQHHQTTL